MGNLFDDRGKSGNLFDKTDAHGITKGSPSVTFRPIARPKAEARLHPAPAGTSQQVLRELAQGAAQVPGRAAGTVLNAAAHVLGPVVGAVNAEAVNAIHGLKRAHGLEPRIGFREEVKRAGQALVKGAREVTPGAEVAKAAGMKGVPAEVAGFLLDVKNPANAVNVLKAGTGLLKLTGSAAQAAAKYAPVADRLEAAGNTAAAVRLRTLVSGAVQSEQYQKFLTHLEQSGFPVTREGQAVQKAAARVFRVERAEEGIGRAQALRRARELKAGIQALSRTTGTPEDIIEQAINDTFDVTQEAVRKTDQAYLRIVAGKRAREAQVLSKARQDVKALAGAERAKLREAQGFTAKAEAATAKAGTAKAAAGEARAALPLQRAAQANPRVVAREQAAQAAVRDAEKGLVEAQKADVWAEPATTRQTVQGAQNRLSAAQTEASRAGTKAQALRDVQDTAKFAPTPADLKAAERQAARSEGVAAANQQAADVRLGQANRAGEVAATKQARVTDLEQFQNRIAGEFPGAEGVHGGKPVPATVSEMTLHDELVRNTREATRQGLLDDLTSQGLPAQEIAGMADSVMKEEDRLLRGLVDTGLITPDRAKLWEGVHLRRLYQKYEDPEAWLKELQEASPEEVARIRAEEMTRYRPGVGPGMRVPKLKERELTLEEAQGSKAGMLGNTAARAAQGQAAAETAIARARLMQALSETPGVVGRPGQAGYLPLPDSPLYGALRGQYVRAGVQSQLTDLNRGPQGIYTTLLNAWKGGKVMNFSTLSRNQQTNFVLNYLNTGLNLMSPQGLKTYAEAARLMREDGPFLRVAERVMPDLVDESFRQGYGELLKNGQTGPTSLLGKAANEAAGLFGLGSGKYVRAKQRIFASSEAFSKLSAFLHLAQQRLPAADYQRLLSGAFDPEDLRAAMLGQGGSDAAKAVAAAGQEASNAIIDYGASSPVVRWAARTGVVPFGRFTEGVLKSVPKAVYNNPQRLLNLERTQRLFEHASGKADQEIERQRLAAQDPNQTLVLPGGGLTVGQKAGPGQVKPLRQVPRGLDLQSLLPVDIVSGQSLLNPMNLPLSNPFYTTATSLATNQDLTGVRMGREPLPIVPPGSTPGQAAGAVALYLGRAMLPTDTPGIGYNWARLADAARQKAAGSGEVSRDLPGALAQSLLGIRTVPLDATAAARYRDLSDRGRIEDLKAQGRRIGRDVNRPQADRDAEVKRLADLIQQILRENQQYKTGLGVP